MIKYCFGLFFFIIVLFIFFSEVKVSTYYVSPVGDDNNIGSFKSPFKTINSALDHLKEGDSLVLREGTYREKVVINIKNVNISSYPGEYVLVTGCDIIENIGEDFLNKENNVISTLYKFDKKVYQLFVDGEKAELARWPNKEFDMLSLKDWEESVLSRQDNKIIAKFNSSSTYPDDFWKNGYYVGLNSPDKLMSTWLSNGGKIRKSINNTLTLSEVTYGTGKKTGSGNGFGYIINCLNALDAENEWFWDKGNLFIKHSETDENLLIEARTRLYILEINADGVRIDNINFKAGNALVNSSDVRIVGCSFRYLSPFVWNSGNNSDESGAICNWGDYRNGSSGISIFGNNFTLKNSYVANSWFSGIVLWGDSSLIENSIIEDVNWMAKRSAGVNSYGKDNVVRYCSIRNTGAASIEGGNARWINKYAIRNTWEYNLCEDACKLVVDQGFFYVNHQSVDNPKANSIWRYNVLKNNRGPDRGEWSSTSVGLYLDNSSSGYELYNNFILNVKEGVRFNSPGIDDLDLSNKIYNNIFYQVDNYFAPQKKFKRFVKNKSIEFLNNIGVEDENKARIQNLNHNLFGPNSIQILGASNFEDAKNLDFRFKNRSNISVNYNIDPLFQVGANINVHDFSVNSK